MNATEIRIETKNEKTPFSRWNINRISKQAFTENPKIRIAGKEIDMREYQNENARDTKIYEVLEKYNGDLKMTQEQLNKHYVALNDELAQINNLADAHKIINEGTKVWNSLDINIRKEFGNNVHNFIKNGETWLNKKINDYNELVKKQNNVFIDKTNINIDKTNTITKGETNNG